MKFGLLHEMQPPRLCDDRAEHRMIYAALTGAELPKQDPAEKSPGPEAA
jgi:hypothetical protein